ncbi:ATPase AAA-type core domain-containing protein [Sphingomonas antarctica]|uniref:ATP-dependent nuclease n=1 Tax=Sphingomonas antarctica TaxID=2040274 RepID=UPI0039EA6E54
MIADGGGVEQELDHFVAVEFYRFKAFSRFSINLRNFNVLVGPNNAGKSTVLIAFRILAAAFRRSTTRKAEFLHGPDGPVRGYSVDLTSISVAEENLFYNYNDGEAAWVKFELSSGNSLLLYFPERETCYLIPDAQGKSCSTPSDFKRHFRCQIGFVPILGPVEHRERLYEKEAARRALSNYGAARNFRNIWYHFPEEFDEFRALVKRTWPGMDVTPPEIDSSHERAVLHMWCPENRMPREIFWAGFGFQVWCQMLTHLLQSRRVSMFLIDEPDIYLHSDLQRQILNILRELGPDVILATHSTEIVTEAETDEIVVVDKQKARASRLKNAGQLESVFRILGSTVNPVLTQLAKTRRVIFVEGLDFQLLSRFARKLGKERLANRSDFAVVPVEGFNPDRIRTLKRGMETTLGVQIAAAAILDRDYRSSEECKEITVACKEFCDFAVIHDGKELENFCLVPDAIDRAAVGRVADRARRSGTKLEYIPIAESALVSYASARRNYVTGQRIADRRTYERAKGGTVHESTLNQEILDEIEASWNSNANIFAMIPGKDALSEVNRVLQDKYNVNVTPNSIVDAMRRDEVPQEMVDLIEKLDLFAAAK